MEERVSLDLFRFSKEPTTYELLLSLDLGESEGRTKFIKVQGTIKSNNPQSLEHKAQKTYTDGLF